MFTLYKVQQPLKLYSCSDVLYAHKRSQDVNFKMSMQECKLLILE